MRREGVDLLDGLRARLEELRGDGPETAAARCGLAREFEEAGDYEGAVEALGERWRGVGSRPAVEDLPAELVAEYLLRAGALTGRVGKGRGVEGAQDAAIRLIGEAVRLFEEQREAERVAECWSETGFCFWQKGAHADARMALRAALDTFGDPGSRVRAIAVVRAALVENSAGRAVEAYRILRAEGPALDALGSHYVSGMFHIAFANALLYLSADEGAARATLGESGGESFADRGLVEYAAAGFHFEQAGHKRHEARVRNNTGYLLFTLDRFDEAHDNLDRALSLFEELGEEDSAAQVNETRARVLLAQERPEEAELAAAAAVAVLERGDDAAQLAQALTTHGRALARTEREAEAKERLERAVEIASASGDVEAAGAACLTIIEELADVLPAYEVWTRYEQADELLADAQRPETINRLRACARATLRVGRRVLRTDIEDGWTGCNLQDEVLRYERELIVQAMAAEHGQITRAAEVRLGMSHQALRKIINGRQRKWLAGKYAPRARRPSAHKGVTATQTAH
jgi:tetratricopeptide (TPR) repeat protein